MLDFTLDRFVAEVRKEDGQEYPGKTLYEILSSIQMYLRVQRKRNITWIDKKGCTFRNLNSAVNFVLKERARQGIGVDVNKANLITHEQENYLWQHGFLGSENAELLCDTLCDELGREFLQYTKDISKTNSGGLSHLCIKRKVVPAYKNLTNVERYPAELYKKYLSHVPNKVSDNAFYLRALTKPNGEIWYYKKAAGRETLGMVVKEIMKKAQFDGQYTNHSLRRSCATRLYDGGVSEQLIQETTGHPSSDGVRAYKCTSSALKREASKILQGSLSKKAVIDVEKKDESGTGEIILHERLK
ncbi:uncharacterized protein LOC111332623 [Stylophora pistillata]|uniref:uncharacterized protein LOC111332623 n=1 Tax=Stylophora pistillata TaxID=50429 RepID=UPI000C04607E|nr:uncharacterized protein LOC111332623 [Stylophora pistillata]